MLRKTSFCLLLSVGLLTLVVQVVQTHPRARTIINVPDILGYQTLKCDFHTHTVFSDGAVWPDIRSEEAWREGLDAIAITDHIEYQPHAEDLPTNHNRSFEIAQPHGEDLMLTVIKGSEVTRDMPPGHLNAIFLKDAEPLDTDSWRDALEEAKEQGAFVFWNHPGWSGQQPDGVARWYPEHTELVDQELLHGIEVVNSREYYPEAHRWCLERNLTMLSNSDVHNPTNLDYRVHEGDHRPITLVFARENSVAAIREALFDRRTAVYSGHVMVGKREFLDPLFQESVEVLNPELELQGEGSVFLQIRNDSDIRFELGGGGRFQEIEVPESLTLHPRKTVLLRIEGLDEDRTGRKDFQLPYVVENLLVRPEVGLEVSFPVAIEFRPEE